MKTDPELIGQILLEKGFETWFRYMFRMITGQPFIIDPIHKDLFSVFDDVYNLKTLRQTINIPPRSAKSTLAKYFIIYSWTINPRCNFIYTSYSQMLVSDFSREIMAIMESDVYKAMYPIKADVLDENTSAVDEFWFEYKKTLDRENSYSTKKIVTYAGGVCLFSSMGSTITGFGAGIRGNKNFTGCIIIDDAQKPADINSLVLRTKTNNYFAETLLSRVNDSNVPILNIQQRLHFEDISGFLEKEYGFNTLKKPLVLEDGSCTIPSQYTVERIEELQKSTIVFSAQYQQEPVPEGGLLIKMEKFNRYRLYPERFDSLFICCDTAFSEKKTADNSAFMLMGIIGKERYILDVYCKKVTFVDLRKDLLSFYHKALNDFGRTSNFSNIYIENKASGISLIQQLRSEGLPILEISPTVQNKQLQKDQITDKYTRFLEIESDIESGYCWLPEQAIWLNELEEQFIHFDGGNQVTHDDLCLVAGTKIKTLFGDKNIEDIKIGDLVITPYGIRKVENCGLSGIKEVEYNKNIGLKGTYDHKVLTNTSGYSNLRDARNKKECLIWNLKNLIIWKIKSLLFLTEKNIAEWGERESISYLMRKEHLKEKTLKDYTLQFGNMSIKEKCRKGMSFTIKTIISLITALIIWNVYHSSNILKCTEKTVLKLVKHLKHLNILKRLENLLKSGTNLKMVENGTNNTQKKLLIAKKKLENVQIVGKNLKHTICLTRKMMYMMGDGVLNVTESNGKDFTGNYKVEKLPVYNLKVNGGVYFANDILVSNCDAFIYCLKVARRYQLSDWDAFADAFR